jgi:hypothetical protein
VAYFNPSAANSFKPPIAFDPKAVAQSAAQVPSAQPVFQPSPQSQNSPLTQRFEKCRTLCDQKLVEANALNQTMMTETSAERVCAFIEAITLFSNKNPGANDALDALARLYELKVDAYFRDAVTEILFPPQPHQPEGMEFAEEKYNGGQQPRRSTKEIEIEVPYAGNVAEGADEKQEDIHILEELYKNRRALSKKDVSGDLWKLHNIVNVTCYNSLDVLDREIKKSEYTISHFRSKSCAAIQLQMYEKCVEYSQFEEHETDHLHALQRLKSVVEAVHLKLRYGNMSEDKLAKNLLMLKDKLNRKNIACNFSDEIRHLLEIHLKKLENWHFSNKHAETPHNTSTTDSLGDRRLATLNEHVGPVFADVLGKLERILVIYHKSKEEFEIVEKNSRFSSTANLYIRLIDEIETTRKQVESIRHSYQMHVLSGSINEDIALAHYKKLVSILAKINIKHPFPDDLAELMRGRLGKFMQRMLK